MHKTKNKLFILSCIAYIILLLAITYKVNNKLTSTSNQSKSSVLKISYKNGNTQVQQKNVEIQNKTNLGFNVYVELSGNVDKVKNFNSSLD